MSSVTLPVIGLTVSLAMAAVVLALCAATAWGFWQLRIVVPRRLKVLEDALKVYNSANATLGCRITELESALQQHRQGAATVHLSEAAPPVRSAQSAAERYESRAAAAPQPVAPARAAAPAPVQGARAPAARVAAGGEFSEAELRLAQLIKSRLSSLRVN